MVPSKCTDLDGRVQPIGRLDHATDDGLGRHVGYELAILLRYAHLLSGEKGIDQIKEWKEVS